MRLFILPFITIAVGFIVGASQPERAGTVSYPEHLTGAFTGGFGEQTCRSCHFDYGLNPEEGSLDISGIPDEVSGGEKVVMEISVEREKLGRAGFQLSARYEDGSQAGHFSLNESDRIIFSESVSDSLQYVQHSKSGSISSNNKNISSWKIIWQAPDSGSGAVIFNIAANAANGDQSEFGDYIYAEEIKVEL